MCNQTNPTTGAADVVLSLRGIFEETHKIVGECSNTSSLFDANFSLGAANFIVTSSAPDGLLLCR
jgi:hypothetical protein